MFAQDNTRPTLGDTYDEYLKYGTPGEREAAQIGFTEGYAQGVLRGATMGAPPMPVPSGDAKVDNKDQEPGTVPLYYTASDIGRDLGVGSRWVLQTLVDEGLLLSFAGDEAIHYRPTEAHFCKGWFLRIEKFLISENRAYFQTVVTRLGRQPILELLRTAREKQQLQST